MTRSTQELMALVFAVVLISTCQETGNVARAANDSGPAIVRVLERIAVALERSNRLREQGK